MTPRPAAAYGTARQLLFDPADGRLLGEREVALPGNRWGYAAGTVVGWAAYERGVVVDRVGERR